MASKSFGQIAGTVIGAAVGFFAGGNVALGASIGGMIGGMIDPPKGPTVVGPRLDDLSFQTSTLGAPLGRAYGTIPVLGNVVWLEGDKYREVITSEEQGGKGGGGTTYETPSYYATFAVSLLRVTDATKTVALRRLWIGSNLVYDAGSDDIDSIIASNTQSSFFSFYSGSDDQKPNTRWQADKGANAVSGFPGRCYIVIYDLDLEPYSRSLAMAQVKAELCISDPVSDIDQIGTALPAISSTTQWGGISLDGAKAEYTVIEYDNWDARPLSFSTYKYSLGEAHIKTAGPTTIPSVGTNSYSNLHICASDRPIAITQTTTVYPDNYRSTFIFCEGSSVVESGFIPAADLPTNEISTKFAVVESADYYVFAIDSGHKVYKISEYGLVMSSAGNYASKSGGVSDNYLFLLKYEPTIATTTIYRINRSDLTLDSTWTGSPNSENAAIYVESDDVVYTSRGGAVNKFVSGVFVGSIGDLTPSGMALSASFPSGWFFVMNADSAVLSISAWPDLDYTFHLGHQLVNAAPASLRDIVTSECGLAGIASGDIDLTALTDSDVRGFRISNAGSIRSSLEMLQAAYPFDVAPSGYKLRFVSRGGASLATIPEADLGAVAGGDSLPVLLPSAREMDTQIPYKVSVRYLDPSREYDIGEQYASRPDTASVSERTVELSLVLTGDEAARAADVLNQKDWLDRVSFGPFSLPPTWLEIEPPDVVTVEHRGQAHQIRLTRAEFLPDGRIECAGVYSAAQSYTSSASTQESLTVGQSLVPLKGSTSGYLLDIPRIRSEQDVPGMSFAMTGLASGWPGGVLLRSDDSGNSWPAVGAMNARAKVFTAGAAISSHHGYSIDHASALTVTPAYSAHTLASVTEDQFYSHANLAAYGMDGRWEIVAFKTTTDNTGSYTIKDFLRGLYGTEWASGLHEAGDLLVMLDTSTVGFFGLPTTALGSARLYRSVTQGAALDSAADVTDTYDAVNLKPLSPVDLSGDRNPTTFDWKITAQRRTRHPVELFSGVSVPLGETAEAYEVELWNSGYTARKRLFSGLSNLDVSYPAADQITDWGSYPDTLYVRAYPLSSVIGRGYPLQTSLYRSIKTDGSGYDDAVLALSPLLYYKLEGNTTTVTDSGSAASNATASATGFTYQQPGLLTGGTGYSVNVAAPGLITSPRLAAMDGAYSAAVICKPSSLSGGLGIYQKGDSSVGGQQGHIVSLLPNGKISVSLFNGSWLNATSSASAISDNEKAVFVFVYDGATNFKIFKNGSIFEALTLPAAFVSNTRALHIAALYSGGVGYSFVGGFDEFAWFTTALTEQNVSDLYEAS